MKLSSALVPFGVALLPSALPAQSPRGTIVSANMTANSASVVDIATGELRATYPTSAAPHEVAISNDGRWAVISVYGDRATVGHSLLVLDLKGESAPRTIETGDLKRPHGMRFLPGDAKLVVTSEVAQRIAIVSFATGTIDTTVATNQGGTHMIVLDGPGKRAITTNIGGMSLSVIDLTRDSLVRTIDAGQHVEGIALAPDGREVWAGANDGHVVLIFDPATGAKVAAIEGFGMPYRMAITPDGSRAVVTDPGAERVMIVDARSHKILHTLEMPSLVTATGDGAAHPSPQGVMLSRDGRVAFVTLKALGQVAVIDVASAKLLKTLTVGGGSDGVGFSPTSAAKQP